MSLVELYHDELQHILDHLYEVPGKPSVMLEGTFGIGKTWAMKEAAKRRAEKMKLQFSENFEDVNDESKFCFLPFILHQYEAGELKGLPFPNEDRTQTAYLPIGLLPTKGQGMIFLDEIKGAAPMLQKNAYQLIEDRKIGFYRVPAGYAVHGAGNRDDDRGNMFDLDMPLNNRMLHAELRTPPVFDCEAESGSVRGWMNGFAIPNKLDNRVVNYIASHQQNLFTYKPNVDNPDPTQGTPRMWHKVSDIIKPIPSTNEYMLRTMIGMGVGSGIATEFVAWLRLSEKYDISGIFKTGKFDKPSRIDQVYSLISAMMGYYLEKIKDKGVNQDKLAVRLLDLSLQFNKEHTAIMLNQAKNSDDDFFKRLKTGDLQRFQAMADTLFDLLI
jgi:hypothetical protein